MRSVKPEQVSEYRKKGQVITSARMMGYTDELYNPDSPRNGKVVGNYGEKAKRLFDNELISETDYHDQML